MTLQRMDGPRVRLAPIGPEDHPFLYNLATSDENAYRWVLRGALPPYELYIEQLRQGISNGPSTPATFVVWDREAGERIGQAVVHDIDQRNGHAHVAVVMAPEAVGHGLGRETLGVLIRYAFAVWPLRKVYADVPDFTFDGVEAGVSDAPVMGIFHVEGRLRSHLFVDGEYRDMLIVGFDRSQWVDLDTFLAAWSAAT